MRHRVPAKRAKKKQSSKRRRWCPGGGKVHQEASSRLGRYLRQKTFRIREEEDVAEKLQGRIHVRCTFCNKRFVPKKIVTWFEREILGFKVPEHKAVL